MPNGIGDGKTEIVCRCGVWVFERPYPTFPLWEASVLGLQRRSPRVLSYYRQENGRGFSVMKIAKIVSFCPYCGSANCGMLVGESICCDAELGADEPSFYAAPNESYADGVSELDGFTSVYAARAAGVAAPQAWRFLETPNQEVKDILAVRSVWNLTEAVEAAAKKAKLWTSVALVKELTGLDVSQDYAQNLLSYTPGSSVKTSPPHGYVYENTGNSIPGGVWEWELNGIKIQEETWWLDG